VLTLNGEAAQINTGPVLSNKDKELKNAITVYPNPVNDILNIKLSDNSIQVKNVDLINIIGKVIYSNINAAPIDVKNLSRGVYILKIVSNSRGVISKKVIVN
jgi:hypothetical protein